jgi:hypothetical protein
LFIPKSYRQIVGSKTEFTEPLIEIFPKSLDNNMEYLSVLPFFTINSAENSKCKFNIYFYSSDKIPIKSSNPKFSTLNNDLAISKSFAPGKTKMYNRNGNNHFSIQIPVGELFYLGEQANQTIESMFREKILCTKGFYIIVTLWVDEKQVWKSNLINTARCSKDFYEYNRSRENRQKLKSTYGTNFGIKQLNTNQLLQNNRLY